MGNCACVYIGDVDDPPEFHRAIHRTAIKLHKCDECGREIKPGKKYEYVTGKWDGWIETYKTCVDCESIRDEMFCEGFFYTMLRESLYEYLREANGELPSECLLSLTPDAQTMVCSIIDEIWEDHGD